GVVVVHEVDRHRLRDVLAEPGALEDGGAGEFRVVVGREVDEPGVARQVGGGAAVLGGAGLAAAIPFEAERAIDRRRAPGVGPCIVRPLPRAATYSAWIRGVVRT